MEKRVEHPTLSVRLFGAPDLRARAGTDWEIHLPHRALSVLARLLLARGSIGRDEVAFSLWPDETEEEARANLRRAIYGITQTLPQRTEPWINATRTTLAWAGGADAAVDVLEYEQLLENGRYVQADSLYTGHLLETLDEPWIEPERERLREAQLDCLMQLLNDARAHGDSVTAMRYAKRALRIDPWREDFERVLIALRRDAGDRAGALQEYKRFASALHGEIGVDPMPETTAEAMQTPAAPLKRTRSTIPSPISSFVGRETELRELTALLMQNRLVSVLGPGGVGKTRLAVAVAHRIENGFAAADFIDVAPVKQAEFFVPAVASALGLRDFTSDSVYPRVVDALAGEPRLLLIDNCERVTETCAAFAARILHACPELRILTTSREPLHVTGEIWYDVQPLPLDDALTLLCDRVRALYPAFSL
ncbi:MAG TPA: BTAD domain-containing putative transcriptional regulator, partial [Candidatus Baltobacteraceae bacterium]|nr:BTAD domain-containing putative transcriptional regulator [Candidatus Baltobacteraceae bacterium]